MFYVLLKYCVTLYIFYYNLYRWVNVYTKNYTNKITQIIYYRLCFCMCSIVIHLDLFMYLLNKYFPALVWDNRNVLLDMEKVPAFVSWFVCMCEILGYKKSSFYGTSDTVIISRTMSLYKDMVNSKSPLAGIWILFFMAYVLGLILQMTHIERQ